MRPVLLAALSLLAGCSVPWEPAPKGENACAKCHGDSQRPGDALLQAAPPNDVYGNADPATPGVGAHLLHLLESPTHAPVACAECHVVPERTGSPGHDDTPGPAELTFGELASRGGRSPAYDAAAKSCGDTYCHGPTATQAWNKPRSSAAACGSCHGLPPAAPHSQSLLCDHCHGAVVGPGLQILAPALHVDGTVQVGPMSCGACHGSEASPAPPRSLDGGTTPDVPGVGAHGAHLGGSTTSRGARCEECHRVPTRAEDPGHVNGATEVVFTGVALGSADGGAAYAESTRTCTTWCHSVGRPDAGSPVWTRVGAPLACDGCHGLPPPPPHPRANQCALCHPNATAPNGLGVANPALHVNGVVEAAVPQACNGCHGTSTNPAPPRDTRGNTSTSLPSVGAHQAHLVGTGFSRRIQCDECHVIPAQTFAPGHPDGVTQVVFSGVALAGGSAPSYQGGTCANSWCHDTRPLLGQASNGGLFQQPQWTRLDGAQVQCNACHGFPPLAPHPQQTDCSRCHPTMADGGTIAIPSWHVDGKLDVVFP